MKRIDGVLGNVHGDDELDRERERHAQNGTLERVVIDADRRQRSRFRTTTNAGTDVGVVLDKPALSIGDVLVREDDRMIVVAFEPLEALAVELPEPTSESLAAAVELGHRVGNQHWDLALEESVVYVPLEADRHIVERVVADVVPGSTVREETVDAELFVTDLDAEPAGGGNFDHEHDGGESDHTHDHTHEGESDHHSHDHEADHTHDNEHTHTHEGDGHDHGHDHHGD